MCQVLVCRASEWRTSEAYLKGFAQPIEWSGTPFEQALAKYEKELNQITKAFLNGSLDAIAFEEELVDLLRRMHIDCHFQGQVMADAVPPSMSLARFSGSRVAQAESQYARAFANELAILSPKVYDEIAEQFKADVITLRARSYMGRARGTATDGWTSASMPSDLVAWELGKEDNCPRCPVMAKDGPYLLQANTQQFEYPTLYIRPGENLTPCKFNCGCSLRRLSDGMTSPQPFSFADPMAA